MSGRDRRAGRRNYGQGAGLTIAVRSFARRMLSSAFNSLTCKLAISEGIAPPVTDTLPSGLTVSMAEQSPDFSCARGGLAVADGISSVLIIVFPKRGPDGSLIIERLS